MEITNLIVYVLAVWRIANLFVNERGPADLFLKIRAFAGISMDENGVAIEIPDTFLAGVLSCVWCSSMWIAFFWTALWLLQPEWSLKLAVPFAFSGGAVLIDTFVHSRR